MAKRWVIQSVSCRWQATMFQVPTVEFVPIAGNSWFLRSVATHSCMISYGQWCQYPRCKTSFFRLVNVSLAGYADCNGLYTMSNLTSIWDSKRVVYERISGGLRPLDKRWDLCLAHICSTTKGLLFKRFFWILRFFSLQIYILECSLLWREFLWMEYRRLQVPRRKWPLPLSG